ncbi:MAG: hypothetical protein NVS1B2_09060 [Vulcanimicrobiaceae bacterium]
MRQEIRVDATDPSAVPSVSTESLYRFLIESLTEYAIFAISPDGIVDSWNAGAERLFGYSRAEIIDRHFAIFFTSEDCKRDAPSDEMRVASALGRADVDRWHVRKNGTSFWGTNTVQPIRDASGTFFGYTKIVRDATDIYTSTEALRASQERYRTLVETVSEYAIFAISDDGNVSLWNAGAQALFGYEAEEIVGLPSSLLYVPEDVRRDIGRREVLAATADGFYHDERWLVRKDGSRFFASSRLTKIRDDALPLAERGFVKVAYNITDRKISEEAMRDLALHDSLTGLPNRMLFIDHLQSEIARAKRHVGNRFAVFFLDIDDFKVVNDSLGHTIADRVLQALATRLGAVLREADLFARLGGDEFAILLTDITHLTEAEALVRRIEEALALPFQIDAVEMFVTVSIGITLETAGYELPEDALRDADIAMYAAKARGRGKHAYFEFAMREPIVARQRLDAQLRRGLQRNEFRVLYQSIVDLRDATPVGFEALVRWQHPSRDLLPPSEFLDVARKTDLLVAIDRVVLRTACTDASTWAARHPEASRFMLSVNMTARQFETADFVTYVTEVLAETQFPAVPQIGDYREHDHGKIRTRSCDDRTASRSRDPVVCRRFRYGVFVVELSRGPARKRAQDRSVVHRKDRHATQAR